MIVRGLAVLPVLAASFLAWSAPAGPGQGAAGTDVETLRLHRAPVRDEARVNVAFESKPRLGSRKLTNEQRTTLELAWGSRSGAWGAEIFVPYSMPEGSRVEGLGDVELFPVKFRMGREGNADASLALGVRLDTGREGDLLGLGYQSLLSRLAFESGRGAWLGGINVSPEARVSGLGGGRVLFGGFLACDPTHARERRTWIPAASVEVVGIRGVYGEERTMMQWEAIPGIHVPLPWARAQVRVGLAIPMSKERARDRALLLQAGIVRF